MTKISDLKPDPRNANKGTQRGLRLLDDSLRELGAGRSILVDREGRIIAGNKTAERAADIGLEDVVIVETDGTKLVAVKRTDLDLENGDDRARRLAYYDNRVGELDLDWDVEAIGADLADGLDLGDLFSEKEIDALAIELTLPDPEPAEEPELETEHLIEVYCSGTDLDDFLPVLNKWGQRNGVTVNIS